MTNYGAIGDGVFTNSDAFQATFDAANTAGGGTVEVTAPGIFLCGPIAMHSNTRFQIDAGATVRLLPYGQYPGYSGGSQSDAFIELDRHGSNFELCGPGLLDGQGKPWWDAKLSTSLRPYEVHMRDVSIVFIHDWNSTNPPMKHIVMDGENNNITIQNATNRAPYLSPSQNTDCINLLGTHCLVQNCTLSGCDDNIAMGRSTGECIDVLITNITCGTGHGISFGSILPVGGVSNVTVINCTFSGTDNGIRFKCDTNMANGSVVRDVRFLNIGMTNVTRPIIIYSYYNEYGSPNNITPAIAATIPVSPPGSDLPVWRDITISNVWGTANTSSSGMAGIIWSRSELCASNITLNNVKLTIPTSFNVYNARNVRFVDCNFTPSSGSFPTFIMFNADVVVTNSTAPGLAPVSFDGLTVTTNQTSNTFSFYNTRAGLSKTNALSSQPRLTIANSLLLVTNHLNLLSSSVFNFALGTNPATVGIKSNFSLGGTINITDGGGLTNGTYILFTNGGTFTSNSTVLGATPPGINYGLDTSTPGQVKLNVLRAFVPPELLGGQSPDGSFRLTFSGPIGQAFRVLASSNVTLDLDSWTLLTNGTFPVPGPLIDYSATSQTIRFYRIASP